MQLQCGSRQGRLPSDFPECKFRRCSAANLLSCEHAEGCYYKSRRYSTWNDKTLKEERVRVEYYVNENTLRERLNLYFIKNQRSSLRIRMFNFLIKILTCLLYISRVGFDTEPTFARCFGCEAKNITQVLASNERTAKEFAEDPFIHWDAILWVDRPIGLWILQLFLAVISLSETLLMTFLGYKGNIWNQLLSFHFILEMVNTIPFAMTLLWSPLKNMFVPVFLNCWLAKQALDNMFNDLHRAMQRSQSALSQQIMKLSVTLLCLVFTSACGIQHFQRAGHRKLNMFQSTYFVIVTFSTVGYGDFVPDIWPSQLYIFIMICVVLTVMPTQRQKLGGSYSSLRAHNEKHVVVCSTAVQADTIMDFLNEFYAHPLLQDFYVVLLSPMELDGTMRMILQIPIWAQRVIYIQGSCLKDSDLQRARMNEAQACFILAARNHADKTAADEHTILRSWAVKDFAPAVPQYVQIFRPENKLHVKFAEHVVCEDEFKYALLANNCLVPGASSLVTLLLHTSRGQEGNTSKEEWQRVYGKCSGNEIYHILLGESRFFGEYDGKSFTYASFHSHRKYGVALVGVRPMDLPEYYENTILLNPGPRHIMKKTDLCFYLSITKEENSAFVLTADSALGSKPEQRGGSGFSSSECKEDGHSQSAQLTVPSNNSSGSLRNSGRRPSILPVPDNVGCAAEPAESVADGGGGGCCKGPEDDEEEIPWVSSKEKVAIIKGFPPVATYVGVSPTLCYLLKDKKPFCCLQLTQGCEHRCHTSIKDYNWPNKAIILASDNASNGIYNFIVPLRAHFRNCNSLNPIVLLLEKWPDSTFLDSICYFPFVYWMLGSIDNIDDLLKAGIHLAENLVVVNKEMSNSVEEDFLADCNTIVAVQTAFRLFPNVRIITELSQSSNMRFMQFNPDDTYALHLSKMEKREKERGSHISYMFRLPFASGAVFSASMLDTLLYQAFVKEYLITFVRLLLGVDQAPGSGFLTSMKISKEEMWIRTYGRLYQKLCSTSCEIPIGIYRTRNDNDEEVGYQYHFVVSKTNFQNLLGCYRKSHTSLYSVNVLDECQETYSDMVERIEIANMVKMRMQYLNLPLEDYDNVAEKRARLSYVLINPNCDMKLEEGDIIYLIRPSSFSAQKTFERHSSRRRSNMSVNLESKRSASFNRCVDATSSPATARDSRPKKIRGMSRSSSLIGGKAAEKSVLTIHNSFEKLGKQENSSVTLPVPQKASINVRVTPPDTCELMIG